MNQRAMQPNGRTSSSRRRRRRTNPTSILAVAGVVLLSSSAPASWALSFSSSAASARTAAPHSLGACPAPSSTLTLDNQLMTQQRQRFQTYQSSSGAPRLRPRSYYDQDELDDDEEEEWDEELVELEMRRFRELRDSTGSEVLQSELQAQIDLGADRFLQEHARDATALEKLAMSSVTSQLPQRAVEALVASKAGGAKQKGGVSPDEEIQLARLIQQGVTLFGIRARLQAKLGRSPTKLEWADQAKLTPKELRRQVSNYRSAKHKLVEANMGLVHAVVNQQYSYYKSTGVSKAELVQEGSLGLLRAAELFDPSRGLRFSTYAVVWVKGTLSNSHLTEFVRLPQREKTKYHKILKAQRDMDEASLSSDASTSSPLSSSATPEQVAAVTGLTVEEVWNTQHRMGQARRLLSLDYEYTTQSRSGTEASNVNALERDPGLQADVDLAERTQLRADILAALARNLDAREARLMRLRYGLSDGHARSLHECAEAMGLSYTRVHQLANRCLKKLRQAAEVEALEEYLLTIA